MRFGNRILLGILAALALGVGVAFAATSGGGTSSTPTGTTESRLDVSGPCDEAEHANDPRCTGTSGPAGSRDGRRDVSGPCDEAEHANDPRCTGASGRDDDRSGPGNAQTTATTIGADTTTTVAATAPARAPARAEAAARVAASDLPPTVGGRHPHLPVGPPADPFLYVIGLRTGRRVGIAAALREDLRREDRGVLRPVERDAGHRDARWHLDDREDGVEPARGGLRARERDADHREVGVGRDRAREAPPTSRPRR